MAGIVCVGLGPGRASEMTAAAAEALERADVVCGYTVYVDLVHHLLRDDQEVVSTGMRSEIERCRAAIARAREGKLVAMVCSGDPGIYGMSGLIYELIEQEEEQAASQGAPLPHLDVEVVCGTTAAVSGAARLGAPLMQDFCVVSLSDLLVPWELIEKRLAGAAAGDFVTVIYNPGSKKRVDHLRRACDIMLRERDPQTVCGLVENIGREGETSRLLTLGELRDTQVDMFTTVFIGNSRTRNIDGKMVTVRGYQGKKQW